MTNEQRIAELEKAFFTDERQTKRELASARCAFRAGTATLGQIQLAVQDVRDTLESYREMIIDRALSLRATRLLDLPLVGDWNLSEELDLGTQICSWFPGEQPEPSHIEAFTMMLREPEWTTHRFTANFVLQLMGGLEATDIRQQVEARFAQYCHDRNSHPNPE